MRRTALVAGALTLGLGLAACDVDDLGGAEAVRGSGAIVTEHRAVPDFDGIVLAGEGDVIVSDGEPASLTIETDDNLLSHIETSVAGRTLEIATARGIDLDPSDGVVYRVTAPEVSAVTLSGAGSVALGECEAEQFSMVLSGAGLIDVGALKADALDVVISGSGRVVVAGEVTSQVVRLSGAGNYDGSDLESARATVAASGVGTAAVWATDELDATVTGVGHIDYYGSPRVSQAVSGIGSITHRGA